MTILNSLLIKTGLKSLYNIQPIVYIIPFTYNLFVTNKLYLFEMDKLPQDIVSSILEFQSPLKMGPKLKYGHFINKEYLLTKYFDFMYNDRQCIYNMNRAAIKKEWDDIKYIVMIYMNEHKNNTVVPKYALALAHRFNKPEYKSYFLTTYDIYPNIGYLQSDINIYNFSDGHRESDGLRVINLIAFTVNYEIPERREKMMMNYDHKKKIIINWDMIIGNINKEVSGFIYDYKRTDFNIHIDYNLISVPIDTHLDMVSLQLKNIESEDGRNKYLHQNYQNILIQPIMTVTMINLLSKLSLDKNIFKTIEKSINSQLGLKIIFNQYYPYIENKRLAFKNEIVKHLAYELGYITYEQFKSYKYGPDNISRDYTFPKYEMY